MYHNNNIGLDYSKLLFRFIDDSNIFGENLEHKSKIGFYPKYLIFKLTNLINIKAQFWDLDIKVVENEIITRVYDKRNFKFKVFEYPYWDSNLHVSIFRNIMLNFMYRNNVLNINNIDRYKNIKEYIGIIADYEYPIDFIYRYLDEKYIDIIKRQILFLWTF